ncbi:YraN family protein [Rhizobium tumorigenes]|uniref:YraN family protein n=1 Tax=Rhizobium tumorigenes TaxID=2041385 RepID=UPI00241C0C21|nr:YraN family protein [Rhizobium tumorigenes]WFS00966.1 YraN family protein [Rhizobium tumorigenes]
MGDSGERQKRRKAWRRGYLSEYLAALYLVCKGYSIVAIRHKTVLGEIDIVARKGDLAVFVEVKARRGEQAAIDAVSFSSQRRIRAASDLWLAQQPDFGRLSQRYDIVAILPGRWPRHFRDAF